MIKPYATAVLAAAVILTGTSAKAEGRRDGSQPFAVVELFTSEGCSSCPPADDFLQDLTTMARAKDLRVFTLGFHVDYWDYLGWPDPFADRRNTQRQRRYAQILRAETIYTPQMIVNGTDAFGGYRREVGQQAINQALSQAPAAVLTITGARQDRDKLRVSYTAGGGWQGAVLNIALVERDLRTDVSRGENAGRLLSHDNSVRGFKSIELSAAEGEVRVDIPRRINLKKASVIGYIQDKTTWRVLGANILDLTPDRP